MCLHNHTAENFDNPCWVTYFFLVSHHVFEQFHLFNFLESTLADCFVCGLWCDQQQWCVVPIGCFNSCHKIGNAWTVLRDHHRHFTRGACEAIGHHAGRAFMGTVPEHDPSFWENIRNWHHGRTNDPKCVTNAVHLKRFYKCLFGGHFHGAAP